MIMKMLAVIMCSVVGT